MTVSTHVSTALAFTTTPLVVLHCISGYTIPVEQMTALLLSVAIGSVFPDIDEPESWIGKRTIFLSIIIKGLFGHRGMTHTLISTIIIMISLLVIAKHLMMGETLYYIALGLSYGWFLHSIGDGHTKSGVPLLLPYSKKKYFVLPKSMRFKTGSFTEFIYGFIYDVIIALAVVYVFKVGYFGS